MREYTHYDNFLGSYVIRCAMPRNVWISGNGDAPRRNPSAFRIVACWAPDIPTVVLSSRRVAKGLRPTRERYFNLKAAAARGGREPFCGPHGNHDANLRHDENTANHPYERFLPARTIRSYGIHMRAGVARQHNYDRSTNHHVPRIKY